MTATLPVFTASALQDLPQVRHGFFTRRGGASDGIFASLNCGPGSGDVLETVAENQARATARLDGDARTLVIVYQVHGVHVETVEAPWSMDGRPQADAMVSRTPGIALGILTADCAPVLLADSVAGVVGAAHAGWRGALAGVVDAVIEAMIRLGAHAKQITAAIGPTIGPGSYEVGPEFPAPFLRDAQENEAFFAPARRDGHFMFDLPAYVARRLERLGRRPDRNAGSGYLRRGRGFLQLPPDCTGGRDALWPQLVGHHAADIGGANGTSFHAGRTFPSAGAGRYRR